MEKDHIEFQPSLTPALSYFKRILLQASGSDGAHVSIRIPDCMHVGTISLGLILQLCP